MASLCSRADSNALNRSPCNLLRSLWTSRLFSSDDWGGTGTCAIGKQMSFGERRGLRANTISKGEVAALVFDGVTLIENACYFGKQITPLRSRRAIRARLELIG